MDEEKEEKEENGGREEAVLEGGLWRRAGAGSTDLERSGAQRRRELTAADIRWGSAGLRCARSGRSWRKRVAG